MVEGNAEGAPPAEIVGVVGLGYVGLPMAVAAAEAGCRVIGLDINASRVAELQAGRSYLGDVESAVIARLTASGRLRATTDGAALGDATTVLICVPTPFTTAKAPDISYIRAAATALAPRLAAGALVILQSTTYPGTTEDEVLPILEAGSGRRVGHDLFLAFSPERINPGDRDFGVGNTPKVVGGVTPACTARAVAFLQRLAADVHPVSSPRAAEMAKLLENIYRSVNIALVNELAQLSERMGIDIWEVIAAASTKPFGFMPFYPGAGVGGHCIPVDPYYLSWKAREYDFWTRFIELAADTNSQMPTHVVSLVSRALNAAGRAVRGSRLLVLGVAFKRGVDDARNSPAEPIVRELLQLGADVAYHDPYVPRFVSAGPPPFSLLSAPLDLANLAEWDAVLIVTGHPGLDYAAIVQGARCVIDAPNVTAGVAGAERVWRIGAPPPRTDTARRGVSPR